MNPPTAQKKKRKKTVKAWAIYNEPMDTFWGYHGVGVHPMCIFSTKKNAEFFMQNDVHAPSITKITKVIKVEITYTP